MCKDRLKEIEVVKEEGNGLQQKYDEVTKEYDEL